MYPIPFLDLPAFDKAAGIVTLPGSKSISNRALLLAGLAEGTTALPGLLASDDTRVMQQALATLGCGLRHEAGVLHVTGFGGQLRVHQARLDLGNAGTAMRPLTAALALLVTTQGGDFELRGTARMHERPIADLIDALRPLGCRMDTLGTPGYPPLRLTGNAGGSVRTGQSIRVRGDVSSQFLTALLMALPLASADAAITIEVEGELISRPYIEITLALLARFGIAIEQQGWQRFTIPQGSRHRSPGSLYVEGDASSASYFIAAGAIAADAAAPLRIEGVGSDSIQGDIAFADAAEAMGAVVRRGPGWLEVHRGRWPLAGLNYSGLQIPDAAMTLAAMALYADGPLRLTGIASWRVKETDRITAMAAELRKLGARVVEGADFIEVNAPRPGEWRSARIHTYDDHRIAMCLSLAAFAPLAGATTQTVVRIEDPRCVAKTFPDYFETLFSVTSAQTASIPVITIDGPTASGKGTLAAEVAAVLGYELLDSGALYRATGLAAMQDRVSPDDEAAVARLAANLDIRFGRGNELGRVWLRGQEVGDRLRHETIGLLASRVSALPAVRTALRSLQLAFRRAPGLVADGRDMGTVIFPDAALKVFLTATPAHRAERRHKQLISKGFPASIEELRADLEARDERDANRPVSPCRPAEDALLLDNSELDIATSVSAMLDWWQQRRPF
ncbi:MAG: bifunctional 3-phosphoshikimate 1-carboxyvinyltransferase/cytidylate kinase [Pseudomonadota bacterium]|nr:bifunctional 3-phosphoshikimate 1-carboxyvinyltransferase/cytidylate kinase [Pseudomonadota bacterium]